MMNLKVIGTGAAGNKAAIALCEAGFNSNDVTLANTTSKDINEKYMSNSIIFGPDKGSGGCGKERTLGKKYILESLKSGAMNLDSIADPDTDAIIIVSSTEGGSGSASTPIIAKYITEVLKIPTIVCLFFGFNTDVRGMQNSIEICQELNDKCGVIGICNSKFIDAANGNKLKAEQMANDEFVNLIKIISGSTIRPASQNIDDTDLYKIITTPGYMCIGSANISKIKNVEQFNKSISTAIDNSTLMDCSSIGVERIGVIFNTNSNIEDFIDYSATIIKDEYGTPYEMFTHVQDSDTNEATVTWISSGMELPIDGIKEIYDNYLKTSAAVNKKKDPFFEAVSEMKGNKEDSMFDMLNNAEKNDITKAKNSFFADFGMDKKNPSK